MKWISVKDRLPKEYKDVLVVTNRGVMYVSFAYITIDGGFYFSHGANITHWRKLPYRPNNDK